MLLEHNKCIKGACLGNSTDSHQQWRKPQGHLIELHQGERKLSLEGFKTSKKKSVSELLFKNLSGGGRSRDDSLSSDGASAAEQISRPPAQAPMSLLRLNDRVHSNFLIVWDGQLISDHTRQPDLPLSQLCQISSLLWTHTGVTLGLARWTLENYFYLGLLNLRKSDPIYYQVRPK